MRKWYLLSAVAACVLVSSGLRLSATAFQEAESKPARKSGAIEWNLKNSPLTIAMSNVGMFSKGHSWHISVNSAGQAELTIRTVPQTRRQFTVSTEQLAELRKVLLECSFFELADEYGGRVPDGSIKTITVTAGHLTKSVTLHFLTQMDKERLREPSQAVRVGLVIRNWFDDQEAVDLRKYDQRVLDATK